jgi:hypothetical protein
VLRNPCGLWVEASSGLTGAVGFREANGYQGSSPQVNPLHRDFADWCAGVIDGDGRFLLSKGGYPSCEITVGEGEEDIPQQIKEVVGGSISPRLSSKSYRWRMHDLRGVAYLLSLVYGRLRLAIRVEQCEKVAQCLVRSPLARG